MLVAVMTSQATFTTAIVTLLMTTLSVAFHLTFTMVALLLTLLVAVMTLQCTFTTTIVTMLMTMLCDAFHMGFTMVALLRTLLFGVTFCAYTTMKGLAVK